MRAVVVEKQGDLGTLTDIPKPVAGQGELLVRVRAVGVNPIDWKLRDSGRRTPPFVLGQDFAGVVDGLGGGAHGFAVGDRIFGIGREHGAFADYTVVSETNPRQPVAKIPAALSDTTAAALPTAGLTALASVEQIALSEGQVLFIVGVTGAVGQFAAQIARSHGVLVAGSGAAASERVAAKLGLEAFIAYDRDDVPAELRKRYPGGVDALLDLADDADGFKRVAAAVRPGGTIASTVLDVDDAFAKSAGLVGIDISLFDSPQSSRDGLERLAALVERGTVTAPIASEGKLEDAVDILEMQKAGKFTGKVVMTV